MVIKNEADNLRRSLPRWAALADAWLIGIDANNTDDSDAVIRQSLGHLPGELVTVKFDGMGPTLTRLVRYGTRRFGNVTHGVLSDADFEPARPAGLDKRRLGPACSRSTYRILSDGGAESRTSDWMYRNVPGVRVDRRTHQTLYGPTLPEQRAYQCESGLQVHEYTGGYQDRSGNKSGNYIAWLTKDLEEIPGDERSVYYLGHAHLTGAWAGGPGSDPGIQVRTRGPGAWHVYEALKWFLRRAEMPGGADEERYFAFGQAAEIYERWLWETDQALDVWQRCASTDPARADCYFYVGQCLRLHGSASRAIEPLRTAADLPVPNRHFGQWDYLYSCLRHLELGRAVTKAAECQRARPAARDGIPGCRCERLSPARCVPARVGPDEEAAGRRALLAAQRACTNSNEVSEIAQLLRQI